MKRLVLLLLVTSTAHADLNLATTSTERPHVVSLGTGLDHALRAEVGYEHVLAVRDRLLIVGAEFAMPWAKPDAGDLELRLGATMPLLERDAWKLSARLGPTVRTSENPVAHMIALGIDARVTAGYYRPRWFAAAQAGVDWAAATHITNSDTYKMHVFPDAKDGWYRSTGGTIRAGVEGGLSFSDFDVVLQVGRPWSIDLDNQSIPFYAMLGVNIAHE